MGKMRSRSKKVRRLKPPLLDVAKSMGKWKPSDDYLLIQSVVHLESLLEVHIFTKFSKKFSLKELENRWFAILYDAPISRMIYKNLKKIHTDDLLRLKKKIPFNQRENSILLNLTVISINPPADAYFQGLLNDYRMCFHESRSVECLKKQYEKLKSLELLNNQIIERNCLTERDKNSAAGKSFEKVEEDIASKDVSRTLVGEKSYREILSYDTLKKHIKRAEADLFLWQLLIDKISGSRNIFSEPGTISVLFSEDFIFPMKKRQIRIGRSFDADIRISSLQSGIKISRIQCTIAAIDSNRFYLINNGKSPVFIDGRPIIRENKTQLSDKSIIEIGKITILFLVNYGNVSLVNSSDFLEKLPG